jgi:hypothetical protein
VVVSAFVLFLPIYNNTFKETDCGIVETILISIHNMIRLFIVDGEFEVVTSNLTDVSPLIFKCYTLLFSFLFVMAPILTFGFVLSFFKNISAYKLYASNYNVDAFIFSELNEKSLALAESLYNNDKKGRLLVFTDVFVKEEEQNYELLERAKELGAICFKNDVLAVNFNKHSSKRAISFFTIGANETESVKLNSFLATMYTEDEIEAILYNDLIKHQKHSPVDCEDYINADKSWFAERLVEEVKKQ